MLENLSAIAKIASPVPAEELTVQLWSNVITQHHSEGEWHAVDLLYHGQDASGIYHFQNDLRPTSDGLFEYTYRVRPKFQPDQWQWGGGFQQNGQLHIHLPAPGAQWTQGPSYAEILPSVYVGNFIAASQAESLGIDAVLNMGEELNLTFAPEAGIAYCKLGTRDGAQHPIADELIQRAIAWIEEQRQQGKRKILIHCRAGIGRSGSIGVAYCFSQNLHWSYQQALDYAWSKKPDIYPHRQLQDSLERLFPR
ncbi:MAG: dual specificity protein phosphatase family protein [Thainema sp.]